ncbi:MAG: hypothetical protein JSS81_02475 [Acidobacteria bacterium]|nr:hypothetical protein [Acidobacteriota bacterium]
MANSPKDIEIIIERAINGLRDMARDKKFNGKGLAELEAQAEKSFAARRDISEASNMKTAGIARREAEDEKTLKIIDQIVAGIVGDDEFGDDSALYEAFGYVRRSQRKSGLTRKRKAEVKQMK